MKKWQVGAVAGALAAVCYASGTRQGFGDVCENNVCKVWAGASWWPVASGSALAAFLFVFPQSPGEPYRAEPVGVLARAIATLIDFVLLIAALAPVAAIPVLVLEGLSTDAFRWSYEREGVLADGLIRGPLIVSVFAAMFWYFSRYPAKGRQTVGQYLMGYRMESPPGAERPAAFGAAALYGAFGMSLWPFTLAMAMRRPDKLFWWNERTRTRPVYVTNG